MAPAVGDILQFTDQQSLLGQLVLNVYHYRIAELDEDADYEDFAQQFELHIIGSVRGIQMTAVTRSSVIVKNLSNGLDIWEEPSGQAGILATGDPMPSFVTWGFRLIRSSALTRHGAKRIAGVGENYVTGNTHAGVLTAALNEVSGKFGTNIVRTGTVEDFVLEPVIVGRFPKGDPDEGQLDLSKINPVSSAQYVRITSQTTRRAGRGA